jgi:hypothetical protein
LLYVVYRKGKFVIASNRLIAVVPVRRDMKTGFGHPSWTTLMNDLDLIRNCEDFTVLIWISPWTNDSIAKLLYARFHRFRDSLLYSFMMHLYAARYERERPK